jgi:cell division septation protein DedD
METRLKERLTGAAILVALIVLLVPEMFHGQRRASVTAGSGDGAPLRSYTIDLNHGQAGAPLETATAPGTATLASGPGPRAASDRPRPPAAVPAPVPAAAPAAAPALRWSVQLGLFAQRGNADRLARSAQARGFAARVSERDPHGRYHVAVAGLPDRAAAQALRQRLRGQGFSAALIAPAAGGSSASR